MIPIIVPTAAPVIIDRPANYYNIFGSGHVLELPQGNLYISENFRCRVYLINEKTYKTWHFDPTCDKPEKKK